MATTEEEFVYHTQYKTANGQLITLPAIMSRQEEALSNCIGRMLGEVPELAELFQNGLRTGNVDYDVVSAALTKAFHIVPLEARKMVCVLVDKYAEWVMDNLTIRGDYLPLIFEAWNEIYNGFSDAFEIVAEHFGVPEDGADSDEG